MEEPQVSAPLSFSDKAIYREILPVAELFNTFLPMKTPLWLVAAWT